MKDMTEERKRIDAKAWALIAAAEALPPSTEKRFKRRPRTSLDEVVKTQKKADELMRQIKYLEEQSRAKERALHP